MDGAAGPHEKAAQQHVVLLSEPAIALLRALPEREGGRVFGLRWSAYANRVLTRLSPGVTLHGFRSTFSTWAHETTSFDHDTIEVSLAHTTGNAVSRAYDRGDRIEKRRSLMAAWATFCAPPTGGNVVAIGGRSAP
jgi:integrase